ncbi:MAG: hypothetical protein Q4B45_03060 [Coriobacteriia bacterium]|nr:hypothetical protein [Coriobacteriia bacterium]
MHGPARKLLLAAALLAALFSPAAALAEEQVYYLGSTVNAGTDTGYANSDALTEKDAHYGWSLGRFYATGFTTVQREDGQVTFLKTTGDDIKLKFRLDQDIDCLNGNSALTINDDKNGYDQRFGTTKSDTGLGRGALIIKQIDYTNDESAPQVYVNYLAGLELGAETDVSSFAEGDYEVALDYEVKNDARQTPGFGPIPSLSILPEYSNYTIRFKFSVRNGDAMVFLLDSSTGSELTNSAVTENGFTVDFAKSHYLNIYVKRSVLSDNGSELVDVRSNEPASDGKAYTDPGIYTITATNPSTNQTTEKIVYVGNDPLLKAYAITGYTLEQIQDMLTQGATVAEDGTIVWPQAETQEASTESTAAEAATEEKGGGLPILPVIVVLVVIAAVAFIAAKHLKQTETAVAPSESKEITDEE